MFESRWLRRLSLRLRSLFQRNSVDRELDEEFEFHVEQRIKFEIARGLSPEHARAVALRAMDGISQRKEECRDVRGVNYIEDLFQDLRYAGRTLRRSPGFAALAIFIMALGIGANTAVFTVVNAVLLKPLSYRDPDRIVTLSDSTAGKVSTVISRQISIPDFDDWHAQSSSFESMAYYTAREVAVLAGSDAEYARVARVSPELFRVFAVEPIVGREFTIDETKPETTGAVMISHAYWQRRYGGDPRALGQTISVLGVRSIVGILPPGFRFPDDTDLWIPIAVAGAAPQPRSAQNFRAVARLKPTVSVEQAQTEMTVIARRLEQAYAASNKDRSVIVARMQDEMVGDVKASLYLLLSAVGVVLLLACANTATLLLGKATARAREVAVRSALGAGRRRIVRQLMTEGLLLALIAGAAGLLLAFWGSKALVAVAPGNLPRLAEARIDRWVLAFTLGVSMLTSLLCAVVPALYASKVDVSETLKQSAARLVGRSGTIRVRRALVIGEIALAALLVCAAGLVTKSFLALTDVPLGFRSENVLVMRATMPGAPAVSFPRARQFFREVLREAASMPGVIAAGATMAPPGSLDSTGAYLIGPLPENPDWTRAPSVVLSIIASGTFNALGIPLKEGRDFNEGDMPERPFVAVVNETLVRQAFPDQNAIGRTIHCRFDSAQGMTIVGVVGDVRQRGLDRDPMPECYMPYTQHAFNGVTLSVVARTTGDPNAFAESFRRLAREKSPDVPMKFTTMERLVSQSVAAPRFRALLFGIFAGLAICLAMAGIYGVMAHAVGQRSNELGIRLALGATAGSISRRVLTEGLVLTAAGLGLGLAAAIAGTRLLTSVLFHVQPTDPVVYSGVAILIGTVALAASYLPARRASRIDPLILLRQV
jgi:predicted permease